MRIKFHVAAGLVTVVFAAAVFLLLGHFVEIGQDRTEAEADPQFAVIPVSAVETPISDSIFVPEPESFLPEKPSLVTHARDIYIEDNRVWVATPDGLVLTDRNGMHYRLIDSAEGVDPTMFTDIVHLGGRTLFCTEDGFYEYLGLEAFRRVELPYSPPVFYAPAFDSLGYLGTHEAGVFQYTPDQPVLIKPDLLVTAMVFAPDGLWVGTDGDGLWRFDGEVWQRRFLRSDTNAFAHVTTLAYKWPSLMVGTPEGLYRYDGGTWEAYADGETGFPGAWITDIVFANHRWYIGTVDHGLWILAGASFFPVEELAGASITRIETFRNDVYVGTQNSGVHVRRAGTWRLLYVPEGTPEISPRLLTLL